MFQGLRTVVYGAPELQAARDWYARALEQEPYFDQPFYVGFNVGGYELGLNPNVPGDRSGTAAAVTYWGVADADQALQRLLELGATLHDPVQDVGEGIRVAAVRDPFGNVVGIIENPHVTLP